mmetsp:Transcript_13052/g.28089  ORF Transcript_13052/g.28089 Transcript_13052/m.28089 type:complete len:148 (+) Transcript_13052:656-1099(+)
MQSRAQVPVVRMSKKKLHNVGVTILDGKMKRYIVEAQEVRLARGKCIRAEERLAQGILQRELVGVRSVLQQHPNHLIVSLNGRVMQRSKASKLIACSRRGYSARPQVVEAKRHIGISSLHQQAFSDICSPVCHCCMELLLGLTPHPN